MSSTIKEYILSMYNSL